MGIEKGSKALKTICAVTMMLGVEGWSATLEESGGQGKPPSQPLQKIDIQSPESTSTTPSALTGSKSFDLPLSGAAPSGLPPVSEDPITPAAPQVMNFNGISFQSSSSPAQRPRLFLLNLLSVCLASPPTSEVDQVKNVFQNTLSDALQKQATRMQSQVTSIVNTGQSLLTQVSQNVLSQVSTQVNSLQQTAQNAEQQGQKALEAVEQQVQNNINTAAAQLQHVQRQVEEISQSFEGLSVRAEVAFNADATIRIGKNIFQNPAFLLLAAQKANLAPETKMMVPMMLMFMDGRQLDSLMTIADMFMEQDNPKTPFVLRLEGTGPSLSLKLYQDRGSFIRAVALDGLLKPGIGEEEKKLARALMEEYENICTLRAQDEKSTDQRSARNYVKKESIIAQAYHHFVTQNPRAVLEQGLDILASPPSSQA